MYKYVEPLNESQSCVAPQPPECIRCMSDNVSHTIIRDRHKVGLTYPFTNFYQCSACKQIFYCLYIFGDRQWIPRARELFPPVQLIPAPGPGFSLVVVKIDAEGIHYRIVKEDQCLKETTDAC